MPEIVIISGPNGAGKSTFARYTLPESMPFLNADEIAKTLPAYFVGNKEREAARQLLSRRDALMAEGRSFALETTLASRSIAPYLRTLRASGWKLRLVFITLTSAELAQERVACRVRRGGHDIPRDTIHRRFQSGRENLDLLYKPLADDWVVFENVDSTGPRLIDSGGSGNMDNSSYSVFADPTEMTRRFQIGVREALHDHQFAGNPVAVWQEGKVIVALPDELRPERLFL